jgi:hypothetical protein
MIVKRCSECPFYTMTGGSLFVGERAGVCTYEAASDVMLKAAFRDAGTLTSDDHKRLNARLRVADHNVVPDACPLRTRDVVVTLEH